MSLEMLEPDAPPFDPDPPAVEVADEVVDAAPEFSALALTSPLDKIKAGLVALKEAAPALDLSTKAGEEAARKYRQLCVRTRTSAEKAYEEANKPVVAAQKAARELRDAIKAEAGKLEKPFDDAIKALEEQREAEKARREQEARERREKLEQQLAAIRQLVIASAAASSDKIAETIVHLQGVEIDPEQWGELELTAKRVKADTLDALGQLQVQAMAREAEAARLREEADRIERERTARAEAERIEREAREAAEAQARAEREAAAKAEAERLAEQRAEIKRQQDELAERQRVVAEAEAKQRAEQEARERAEREAAEAQARAAREAEEREAARIKAEADAAAAQRQEEARVEAQRLIDAAEDDRACVTVTRGDVEIELWYDATTGKLDGVDVQGCYIEAHEFADWRVDSWEAEIEAELKKATEA